MKYNLFTLFFLAILGFSSCVKNEFDVPPINGEQPDITANTTIAELKAMAQYGELTEIKSDVIISGVVIADDKSGNFYKTIIIQDATGGLTIKIGLTDAYNLFPIGRELFIKAEGLVIGDYNGVPQLGGYIYQQGGVPTMGDIINFNDHIIKGMRQETSPATVVTLEQLGEDDINTLVTIENVLFTSEDRGQPYADAFGKKSLSREVTDCVGNTFVVRTSGYAEFANEITPDMGGSITGIYVPFRTTVQLVLRSTDDVVFNNPDICAGGGNSGGGTDGEGTDGGGNGGGSGDPSALINENFDEATIDQAINLTGWMNESVSGNLDWKTTDYQGNNYAEVNPFSSGETNAESWLITPSFNLAEANTLQFESMHHHWKHDGLSVWISTDFNGNIATANWTELSANIPSESDDWYNWKDSGVIDLSSFSGTAYIGFKYVGDAATNSSAYSIDNVVVR